MPCSAGPVARYRWLLAEIKEMRHADVMNSDFVDRYVAAFGMAHKVCCWGANVCPQLGKDLAQMAKCSALKRWRVGLGSNWQPGFPRWVWGYEVGHAAYLYE